MDALQVVAVLVCGALVCGAYTIMLCDVRVMKNNDGSNLLYVLNSDKKHMVRYIPG